MDIKFGPFKYGGNNPLKDILLAGVAGLAVYGGYRKVKHHFDEKEKDAEVKRIAKEAVQKLLPPEETVKEQLPPEEPEDMTIQQACAAGNSFDTQDLFAGPYVPLGGRCLLVGGTGLGKSILAMQLGIEATSGQKSAILAPNIQASPKSQLVLYYDTENTEFDINGRYGSSSFQFPSNFRWISGTFSSIELLSSDIEKRLEKATDNVLVVIDNLSAFISSSQKCAREIFTMQREIQTKADKKGYKITFITISHTIKGDPENFRGSGTLQDLASTSFYMLPTCYGDDHVALKFVKSRAIPVDKSEVVVVKRMQTPYLHFEYVKTTLEDDAKLQPTPNQPTPTQTASETESMAPNQKIPESELVNIALFKASGKTEDEIAEIYGVTRQTIYRKLKEMRPTAEG